MIEFERLAVFGERTISADNQPDLQSMDHGLFF